MSARHESIATTNRYLHFLGAGVDRLNATSGAPRGHERAWRWMTTREPRPGRRVGAGRTGFPSGGAEGTPSGSSLALLLESLRSIDARRTRRKTCRVLRASVELRGTVHCGRCAPGGPPESPPRHAESMRGTHEKRVGPSHALWASSPGGRSFGTPGIGSFSWRGGWEPGRPARPRGHGCTPCPCGSPTRNDKRSWTDTGKGSPHANSPRSSTLPAHPSTSSSPMPTYRVMSPR